MQGPEGEGGREGGRQGSVTMRGGITTLPESFFVPPCLPVSLLPSLSPYRRGSSSCSRGPSSMRSDYHRPPARQRDGNGQQGP